MPGRLTNISSISSIHSPLATTPRPGPALLTLCYACAHTDTRTRTHSRTPTRVHTDTRTRTHARTPTRAHRHTYTHTIPDYLQSHIVFPFHSQPSSVTSPRREEDTWRSGEIQRGSSRRSEQRISISRHSGELWRERRMRDRERESTRQKREGGAERRESIAPGERLLLQSGKAACVCARERYLSNIHPTDPYPIARSRPPPPLAPPLPLSPQATGAWGRARHA